MTYLNHGSFKFGGVDMYQKYGIMILDTGLPKDYLIPSLRPRKIRMPRRHGEYDFGAKYYDERTLTLDCVTVKRLTKYTFRTFAREVSWALSKKSEIRLWNEPEKYYIGRIYDEIELVQIPDTGFQFKIDFICDPFAYSEAVYTSFDGNQFIPDYKGTAPTPTFIEIVNNGNANAKNIRISMIKRKDT